MGYEIVQITVGQQAKVFSIHKNLLVRTGQSIAAMVNKPLGPGETLTWPEIDPATFKVGVVISSIRVDLQLLTAITAVH